MKLTAKIGICIALIVIPALAYSQVRPGTVSPNDTARQQKESFLEKILKAIAADTTRRSVNIPTEKNERITYEFTQQKIYPSEDALDLIHILNPWLDTAQTIATSHPFVMPIFPWIKNDQRKKLKANLASMSRTDEQSSDLFYRLTDSVNDALPAFMDILSGNENINQPPGTRTLADSLTVLNTRMLPALKNRAGSICKGKMDYYNNNLSLLVKNMQQASDTDSVNDDLLNVVYAIVDDFFSILATDTGATGFHYNNNKAPQFNFYNASYKTAGDNTEQYYTTAAINTNGNVLNCRIYIYDTSGQPLRGRFQMYVVPYISVSNLRDCGPDLYECIKNFNGQQDAGISSTAAAAIPNNSNWAIYVKDLASNPNHTYLVDKRFNFQNITDRDDNDNSFFKICLLYRVTSQ